MLKRIGKAAITWTSTEDTPIIERVHQLRVPLFDARPAHTLHTYGGTSLDGSVRETFTIESGAHDFVATVRMDDNPQSLMDLIRAGSRNTTLTYYPSLQDADTSYSVKLISPLTPAEVGIDGQLGSRGARTIELRFRQTDASAFRAEAFQGSNVLFRWKAGDELSGATFTRADSAVRTLKGWGTLVNTTNGRPRIDWASTAGTTGYRDTPTLLLEASRTNLLAESEDFSSATNAWVTVGGVAPTRTSEQSDPYGGTAAWLIADTSTAGGGMIRQTWAAATTGNYGFSVFTKQSDGSTNTITIASSGGTNKHIVKVTWSSGVPTLTSTFSTNTANKTRDVYAGGWWRVGFTGPVDAIGSAWRMTINVGLGAASTGGNYFFGAQVE